MSDISAGNLNLIDEGYFDGASIFDWWKRKAKEKGVTFLHNEVVGLDVRNRKVTDVKLANGAAITCGLVVNCAGPRAAKVARFAGLAIPVEPRKRYTFVFDAFERLEKDLPLTIDPSGVHVRTDGRYYMAGCAPEDDQAVASDDFLADPHIWEDKVWPILAHRIPAFERIKLMNFWVGHYAYNSFDQNAIIGPHETVENFLFVNGFSGHGFQQAPAIGRGVAEWITYGDYQSLDLSALSLARISHHNSFLEANVI